jgi:hypothetical protein
LRITNKKEPASKQNEVRKYLKKFDIATLEKQHTENLEMPGSEEDLVLKTDETGYHLMTRDGLLLMDSCQAEYVQDLDPVLAYVEQITALHLGILQARTFVHSVLLGNSLTSLCHHHSFQSCCQGHNFPHSCQNYCHDCLLMSMALHEVVGYC